MYSNRSPPSHERTSRLTTHLLPNLAPQQLRSLVEFVSTAPSLGGGAARTLVTCPGYHQMDTVYIVSAHLSSTVEGGVEGILKAVDMGEELPVRGKGK